MKSVPLEPARLTRRVVKLNRSAGEGIEETESVLLALGQAVELRDRATGGHCERLALFSLALGAALGLSHEELLTLYQGAYLHDIGKVLLPDSVLFKRSPLDAGEWKLMRAHPAAGVEICRRLRSLGPVLPVIRSHHERWDGSGYPDGLKGREIPLLARILQLADIYDALTTERPYKSAFTPEEALAILTEEAARGWREPELVKLFVRLHARVITELADHAETEHRPGDMRLSLMRLQQRLAADARSYSSAPRRLSVKERPGVTLSP